MLSFLRNTIAQFQARTGRSVNYACFLHNYLGMVSSKDCPTKKKLWNLFPYLNPWQPGNVKYRSLMSSGALQTQRQPLFQIDRIPCCRMSLLSFFPRDCVESLNHLSVPIVFATLFILTVQADSKVNVMLHRDRLCCPYRLLIYFTGIACFWIVVHLLFKGIVRLRIIMARQRPNSFWFGKLSDR